MNFICCVILILIVTQPSLAQNWTEVNKDKVTAKFGFASPKLDIEITDNDKVGPRLYYTASNPTRAFITTAYNGFGLSAGVSGPITDEDKNKYGESKTSDFQFRFQYTQWSFSAFYQKYTGYYLKNADTLGAMVSKEVYPQFPDMSTYHLGLGFIYTLDPNSFSLTAPIDHTVRQTKSGWSWLLSGNIGQHQYSTTNSIIPSNITNTYGEFEKVRSCDFFSLNLGGGLAGSFIIYENFYISAAYLLLLGQEAQVIQKTDVKESKIVPSFKTLVKAGLGYNGTVFISGITLHADSAYHNISNSRVASTTIDYGFFIGTRF